jgi:type II secretory pathway pseudopilin PulG
MVANTQDSAATRGSNDRRSKARHFVGRLRRRVFHARDDESGLTTLEWLLIVAAVAGLAALAVVLVTNVVDQTSEQISGSSARVTAARVAAQEIVSQAAAPAASQPASANTWVEWEDFYTRKCNRLEITYGDAGITVTASFEKATGADDGDNVTAIPDTAQAIEDTDDATTGINPHAPAASTGAANCMIS